jgi:anthraniloyl-CoA monooxygenase
MAVGNITSADQVNTIVVSGRADLVALARAHLADPYFTLRAAAWYQHSGQFWPRPYLPGRDQAYRLAVRDREEWTAGRQATKPPSHEVKEEKAKDERTAKSGGAYRPVEPASQSSRGTSAKARSAEPVPPRILKGGTTTTNS